LAVLRDGEDDALLIGDQHAAVAEAEEIDRPLEDPLAEGRSEGGRDGRSGSDRRAAARVRLGVIVRLRVVGRIWGVGV
jgi:hypothetical protein